MSNQLQIFDLQMKNILNWNYISVFMCLGMTLLVQACGEENPTSTMARLVIDEPPKSVTQVRQYEVKTGMQGPTAVAFRAKEADIKFILAKNRLGKNPSDLQSYFKIMDDEIAVHATWWPISKNLRKLDTYGGVHDPSYAGSRARIFFVDWESGLVYAYLEQAYRTWIDSGLAADKAMGTMPTRMVTEGVDLKKN